MLTLGRLVSQSEQHNTEKERATALQDIQHFWGHVAHAIANDTIEATSHKKGTTKKPKTSGELEDKCKLIYDNAEN